MKRVYVYTDELNDDFGGTVKRIKPLPAKYRYIRRNPLFRLFSCLIYRLVARPLAFCYVKIRFGQRFVNKKALRGLKGGYFLFANHVTLVGDACMPQLLSLGRRNYVITGEQTSSLTPLLGLLNALGNIPLAESASGRVQMLRCVKKRIAEGASVTVYPEKHVWPYYTDIRPYHEECFHYAVMTKAPIVAMTTCFQKRRLLKTPRILSVIEGPFYPSKELARRDAAMELRDRVYEAMKVSAARYSTYAAYEYKKKEDVHDAS